MMTDKQFQDLIDSTLDLADSVDPSGKIAKHCNGLPHPEMEEVVDWVLDLHEAIAEAAEKLHDG